MNVLLIVILGLFLIALAESVMGSVVGPALFAFELFAGGALFLLSATSPDWVGWFRFLHLVAGVALLLAGGLEVAAAREYRRPGGPSGKWRATAALTGLAGSVGGVALLLWIVAAAASALIC